MKLQNATPDKPAGAHCLQDEAQTDKLNVFHQLLHQTRNLAPDKKPCTKKVQQLKGTWDATIKTKAYFGLILTIINNNAPEALNFLSGIHALLANQCLC